MVISHKLTSNPAPLNQESFSYLLTRTFLSAICLPTPEKTTEILYRWVLFLETSLKDLCANWLMFSANWSHQPPQHLGQSVSVLNIIWAWTSLIEIEQFGNSSKPRCFHAWAVMSRSCEDPVTDKSRRASKWNFKESTCLDRDLELISYSSSNTADFLASWRYLCGSGFLEKNWTCYMNEYDHSKRF